MQESSADPAASDQKTGRRPRSKRRGEGRAGGGRSPACPITRPHAREQRRHRRGRLEDREAPKQQEARRRARGEGAAADRGRRRTPKKKSSADTAAGD